LKKKTHVIACAVLAVDLKSSAAGDPVFLGRTILASLIGRPDIAVIAPENQPRT